MSRFMNNHLRQAPKRTRARRKMARRHREIQLICESVKCKHCGCTNDDCRQCIEAQGAPCHWVALNVCSRCADEGKS